MRSMALLTGSTPNLRKQVSDCMLLKYKETGGILSAMLDPIALLLMFPFLRDGK